MVDLDAHRVVLNVQTQGLHVTPTNTNIPYAYLQPSLVFGLSEYTRDAKKHNGNRAPSQDPQRKAEVRRRAFISEELWERLRILGPTQLCRLAVSAPLHGVASVSPPLIPSLLHFWCFRM